MCISDFFPITLLQVQTSTPVSNIKSRLGKVKTPKEKKTKSSTPNSSEKKTKLPRLDLTKLSCKMIHLVKDGTTVCLIFFALCLSVM